jgi:predicted O-methyltransferase YrrM
MLLDTIPRLHQWRSHPIYAKCRELGATTVLDLGTGIGNAWRAALYGGTARVTTVDHDKTFTALAQSAGIPSEQLCTLHAQIAPCEGLGPYNLTSISDEPFDLAIVDGPDDDNRAKILSARQVKSRSFIFCNITQDDTSLEEFIAISRSACREIRVERLEIDRGVCILSFPGRLHSIPSVIWDEESRMLRTITSISSQKKDDMAPAPPTNPYYPCYVWTDASRSTIHNIRRFGCRHIAEVGILHGATTVLIARFLHSLGEDTSLHIFDFEERVQEVDGQIRRIGYPYLTSHATSHKLMDSYNWALMQLIKSGDHPIFDYIFLDGAHTWQVDALAFFLLDKLLKVGGYIEFDDYHWSIAKSPTMNPEAFPMSAEMYTEEQIQASHVGLIIDLLVRTNKRYKEIETNRTFQKLYNC